MSFKRTRRALHQNAELRAPTISDGVLTGGTLASATLTDAALADPVLTDPVVSGALSGGTLNTDLAGAAAALSGNLLEGANPTVLPTGATLDVKSPPVLHATITLAADTLDIEAANDYGALQLSNDLPAAYMLVATKLALTFTHADLTGDASTVDVAVGTVTTASVDFTNAGEDDLREKIDATGTTTGTVTGLAAAGASLVPGITTDLFLNASSPVTAGTGVLTLTGDIDVWYIPLL